jgi:MtN3 and saliva related transmembrane protein
MQWFGFAGGLMVAFGFVPQIVKVLRTRSSQDLSSLTLLVIFMGGLLYTVYSFHVGDRVFILINLLATGNTMILLLLKWRYR